ncbi:MAG: NADH-quinone oxidoreductase subunit C [Candidatus Aminicenantes bacterium]|nr:NADH-quinone oxidoreductase subunit C [Candidatus Aminicenantes bacterium]
MAMEEAEILSRLKNKFPQFIKETFISFGMEVAIIEKNALLEIMKFLKEKPQDYAMLLDLTCVDYLGEEPRFEMVYHLFSLSSKKRLRIKARVSEKEPKIASLTSLWRNANWLEREVYDLFGIEFVGHPDLRRIFMYDGFEGYPLRKDYPLKLRQPRIKFRK